MGGITASLDYVTAVLKSKKSVVTSNKELYCKYGHILESIAKDNKVGLMDASGGMSGPTQYYDEFTTFNWSAPTVANTKSRTIGKDCVIINNNQLRNPILPMVLRYASLLAHADISLCPNLYPDFNAFQETPKVFSTIVIRRFLAFFKSLLIFP